MFGQIEEQTRKNMVLFTKALSLFNPFAAGPMAKLEGAEGKPEGPASDLDEMKRELVEMQRKLEKLTRKG